MKIMFPHFPINVNIFDIFVILLFTSKYNQMKTIQFFSGITILFFCINVDAQNVGVGTLTPTEKLTVRQNGIGISQEDISAATKVGFYTVQGFAYVQTHTNDNLLFSTNNGAIQMTLTTAGNVGIGTSAPNARLVVTRGTSATAFDGTAAFAGTTHVSHFNYGTAEDTYIRGGKDNGRVFLADNPGGAVGIGTQNTAGYKLAVSGNIRTKEVVVETGWADFVFAKEYKLLPLSEVESFIKTNNHLPDIPSAIEIQTNGLKVGEMQTKAMQKIEELTLYIIEMKKEMEALKNIIDQKK